MSPLASRSESVVSAPRVLVGYTGTASGEDALQLGLTLARCQGAELHLVMVAPQDSVYAGVYPHDRGYGTILEEQLGTWLQRGLDAVHDDVTAFGHVVASASDAAGLISAAEELGADMIVIGARTGGILRRYRLGSVANTLLHSAPVPVALAPTGYRAPAQISRVTCMFGSRAGSVDVIGTSIRFATQHDTDLRLVSLVLTDYPELGPVDDNTRAMNLQVLGDVIAHGNDRLAAEADRWVSDGRAVTTVVAGSDVEHAVDDLSWDPDEVVFIGSSRLAASGRTFLGTTGAKLVRTVPVPMIIVPADRATSNPQES